MKAKSSGPVRVPDLCGRLSLAGCIVRLVQAGIGTSRVDFVVGRAGLSTQWVVEQNPRAGELLGPSQRLRVTLNARGFSSALLRADAAPDTIRQLLLTHAVHALLHGGAFEVEFARWWLDHLGHGALAAAFTDAELRRFWPALASLETIVRRPADIGRLLEQMLMRPIELLLDEPLELSTVRQRHPTLSEERCRLGNQTILDGRCHVLGRQVILVLHDVWAEEQTRLVAEGWLDAERNACPGRKLRLLEEVLFRVYRPMRVRVLRRARGWVLSKSGECELGATIQLMED